MKIKKEILDKIDNPQSRTRIAMALGQGENSIVAACKLNQENGTLTKYAALRAIAEDTGLSIEHIVEEISEVKEPQS